MRPMRAHHEKKLKQELVGVGETSVGYVPQMSVTILATNLAKLARPVREDTRKPCVRQVGIGGSSASVETASGRPAAVEAVFGVRVHPQCVLRLKNIERGELIAGAPKKLVAEKERMVDGPAQRLPAQRGVGAVEIGEEVFRIERRPDSRVVVPACVRPAEVDVGRFSELAVEPQMTDDANVLAAVGGENLIGITPINLGCPLEEPVLGRRQNPRKRDTRISDAVFAPNEIVRGERPIDERQGVIMNGVEPPKFSAHLADLQKQARRKRCERDVAFFNVHTLLAKREKGITPRVGVDDGLHADLGLMQFQRGRRRNGVVSRGANKVANQTYVWIEQLGVGGGPAVGLRLSVLRRSRARSRLWPSRNGRARACGRQCARL